LYVRGTRVSATRIRASKLNKPETPHVNTSCGHDQ
jgi:hypothetical protein